MPSKRRILRVLLQVSVLLLIAGYGAFSTFLFNPFEGKYPFDIASLVPREVDFFLAKAELARDFDEFPRPAFADDLEGSSSGRAFLEHPEIAGLVASLGIDEALAGLEEGLAQLPVQVDILGLFGGEDIAVAGFVRAGDLSQADWAVYGRTSTLGKLGVELLQYPDLLGLAEQGITVEAVGEGISIASAQLPRKLYVKRILDVVVISTTNSFIDKALELEANRGENSFGQSAKYGDNIGLLEREGNELELFFDYRMMSQALKLPVSWPDPYSSNFSVALLGKLFQTDTIRELIGVLGFGKGINLRLHGDLSSENMSSVQKRLYRLRGFDKAQVRAVASIVPQDVGLFIYGHADLGDLLREALQAVDNEGLISNMEDAVRAVWGYSEISPLIDDLDTAFKDRFAFAIRNDDYPDEGESGPPHNDTPVPAWALILWTDQEAKIEALRERVHARQSELSISGREPGTYGVFENTVKGGYKVFEYWSSFIPGTGHLATVYLEDYFIVSNNHQMLGAMVKTYFDGAPEWPRLSEEPYFLTLVNTGLPSSNVMVWFDPRAIAATTREFARDQAQFGVEINWDVERPRLEKKILSEKFPGATWGSLSPDIERQLDMIFDVEVEEFKREYVAQHAPLLRAEANATLDAIDVTSGTLLQIAFDQKALELFLRVVVPFD